jgi:hypothetical protein
MGCFVVDVIQTGTDSFAFCAETNKEDIIFIN